MLRNSNGHMVSAFDMMATRIAYDENGSVEYIGVAEPGTLAGDSKWVIKKFVYTDGSLTAIQFAGGKAQFIFEWDEREGYTYV